MAKSGVNLSMVLDADELKKLQHKLEAKLLLGNPLKKLLGKATAFVSKEVEIHTPVQTGRLRASITPEVAGGAVPEFAQIGTNVAYASTVEYGGTYQGKPFPPRYVLPSDRRVMKQRRVFKGIGPFQHAWNRSETKVRDILKDWGQMVEKFWSK
jgi:phage gpG-like protein|tara:strand:+ start:14170 stop:14631 length:462 start_codon:yes stop_codon:yes gene_type:complete